MHHRSASTCLLRLSFLASIAGLAFAQNVKEDPAFDQALARYNDCRARLPFLYHTAGRTRLANTRDPRALTILVEDYRKTKDYAEYARYTIAHLLGRHFTTEAAIPQLEALRKENDKPVDTWLWVKALRVHIDGVGDIDTVAIATEAKQARHRAAAIMALGESRHGRIGDAILFACLNFPRNDEERSILLGAMSGALWERRREVNSPEYRRAIEAYISLLDPKVGLPHTSKIQMARHLQWILKGPALFVNPEPWLEMLERGEIKSVKPSDTRAQPRFFGIETEGERFCYVVDMSDSMGKDIEPSAKPQAAVTGPRVKKPKGVLPDESDLPWHKIKTRWDLAREQLRISLLRLPDDKYFSVVWFGTEAGTLDACKGMQKATKSNVNRALAELDAIELGPKDPVKSPDGQLRGSTNMHSGLRHAFGLTRKGYVGEAAYVDGDVLTEGCDTIFLLSDGAPSSDDFVVVDKDYGEDKVVVDNEYGAAAPRSAQIRYHGPYDQDDWLAEDVRRMNAFRRIRMHCVGLGEANMGLLRRLAEMGHGEAFSVGQRSVK